MLLIRSTARPVLSIWKARHVSCCLAFRIMSEYSKLSQPCRYNSQHVDTQPLYDAIIAGDGPAGLAVVGNLLAAGKKPILWVGSEFHSGRLNSYRAVPSNTKVKRFLMYAEGVQIFRDIIAETPTPNAYTALKDLDPESTCHIAQASDLCAMLAAGLDESKGVHKEKGNVSQAQISEKNLWTVHSGTSSLPYPPKNTKMLVLCTGSHPRSPPIPLPNTIEHNIQQINLDAALDPPHLSSLISPDTPQTVGLVGTSHSALLILRNLYNLASTTHPQLRTRWFRRSKMKYAEERDGWILYDNTGLKGDVAIWAKENVEGSRLSSSDVGKYVEECIEVEKEPEKMYERYLPGCNFLVQAVGFERNKWPAILAPHSGERLVLRYDNVKGGFYGRDDGREVPGLFGAGIAFPERVTDPEGNVEHAVGMWKFMSYLQRVVPQWVHAVEDPKVGNTVEQKSVQQAVR